MNDVIRFIKLIIGLFLYALGIVFLINANIGYAPWEVFHAGIGNVIGMRIGTVSIWTGVAIGILAYMMGEKIGIGTLLNMVLIGYFMNVIMSINFIPIMYDLIPSIVLLVSGLFTISLASFFYIGAAFGAGPRDSLMVALRRKTGYSVGLCRSMIEATAVFTGWLLGGLVGAGTVISAFGIGFCVQLTFKLLKFDVTTIKHESLDQTFKRLFAQ